MDTLSLLFMLFVTILPQDHSASGIIRGTVTSKSTGEPLAYARVVLKDPPFITSTDVNGTYRLTKVRQGIYDLTFSAPGFARLTFRGLFVLQFPLVINVQLRDSATASDSTIVVKFGPPPKPAASSFDGMKFYQPDSTIDYKIRIFNPDSLMKRRWAVPDSSVKR